jgi:hypothetical protein
LRYWSNGLACELSGLVRVRQVFTVFKRERPVRSSHDRQSTPSITWSRTVLRASLKANDVKLIVYVPDRVFTP